MVPMEAVVSLHRYGDGQEILCSPKCWVSITADKYTYLTPERMLIEPFHTEDNINVVNVFLLSCQAHK